MGRTLSNKIEKLKEETDLEIIIADGAFVSDEVREECKENEVEIVTSAIRGRSPKNESEDRLTSKNFDIDEESGKILNCPAGLVPRSQKITDQSIIANFDLNVCIQCDKKHICPAFISDKLSRIVIDDKRIWLDERHELLKNEEYRILCNLRPPVEGLMEKMKPKYLAGRTLFRGLVKVKTRMILRAIGINFKRYRSYREDLLLNYLKNLIDRIKNSQLIFISKFFKISWAF